MENEGVQCNVCECTHNGGSCKCTLPTVEITHEHTAADAVSTPHFCKSYEER